MTFMSVSSTPFPFLKKSLQNAPTSRDQHLAPLIEVGIHHTSHFLTGFMALPRGQTKSLAKSGLLEKGPWKLNVMIATCSARQDSLVGSHLNAEHSWTVRSGLDPLLQRLVPIL